MSLPIKRRGVTISGLVKTMITVALFQVDGNTAVIEFLDPTSAEKFCASTNRKMMDLSLLNVSRI